MRDSLVAFIVSGFKNRVSTHAAYSTSQILKLDTLILKLDTSTLAAFALLCLTHFHGVMASHIVALSDD